MPVTMKPAGSLLTTPAGAMYRVVRSRKASKSGSACYLVEFADDDKGQYGMPQYWLAADRFVA